MSSRKGYDEAFVWIWLPDETKEPSRNNLNTLPHDQGLRGFSR